MHHDAQHQHIHGVHRFRLIPTFGRDTIRKFTGDTSAMKKMSARHFEDILQVGHVTRFATPSLNLSHLVLHPCV